MAANEQSSVTEFTSSIIKYSRSLLPEFKNKLCKKYLPEFNSIVKGKLR